MKAASGLALATLLAASHAMAQTARSVPEIGMLISGPEQLVAPLVASFRSGLAEQGHRDNDTVRLIVQRAQSPQQFDDLAPGLPQRPAVVVGASVAEVRWLTRRYPATPVVMVAVGDPVGFKLVESLAKPGGWVTGLSDFKPEYGEMRLALALDLVPRMKRIGFIHNPDAPTARFTFEAASRLGIEIIPLVARTPADLDTALERVAPSNIDALQVVPYPLTFANRKRIAERAAAQRIPVFFGYPEFMDLAAPAAGLASLGADLTNLYRRAAGYSARILGGANPAELEIGRPEREMLVINAQTAKALGLTVPADLLKRAGRVIE